jgi:hypothetical protein
VQIVRRRPPAPARVLTTLPPSYDLRFTSVAGRRVLFDRVRCPDRNFDVYAVPAG